MRDSGALLIVHGNASIRARMLAYRMARLVQRTLGHRYVSFQYPERRTPDWTQWRTVAYIAIREGVMVGYLVSRMTVAWGEADLTDPDAVVNTGGHVEQKALVDLVFVCPGFRRQGTASALVQAMAEDRGFPSDGLLWRPPFGSEGLGLVKRFNQGKVLVS
jgi:GNAT superfamily N-acetyltransferase